MEPWSLVQDGAQEGQAGAAEGKVQGVRRWRRRGLYSHHWVPSSPFHARWAAGTHRGSHDRHSPQGCGAPLEARVGAAGSVSSSLGTAWEEHRDGGWGLGTNWVQKNRASLLGEGPTGPRVRGCSASLLTRVNVVRWASRSGMASVTKEVGSWTGGTSYPLTLPSPGGFSHRLSAVWASFTGASSRGACRDRGPGDAAAPEETEGGSQDGPPPAPGEGAAAGAGEPPAC